MTYLIKASHKHGAEILIGTVESPREDEFYKLPSSGNTVVDSVPTLLAHLKLLRLSASLLPMLRAVVGALPEIRNLDYTIVEVKEQ